MIDGSARQMPEGGRYTGLETVTESLIISGIHLINFIQKSMASSGT